MLSVLKDINKVASVFHKESSGAKEVRCQNSDKLKGESEGNTLHKVSD